MYQSIFYDRSDYVYYLRDDKHGWKKNFKYDPTRYQLDPDGDLKTIFGQSVSVAPRAKFRDPNFFENDVDRDTRLLVDLYYESDDTPSFHNIVYFDIECEIVGALTPENIKDPKGKITSVAVYDNNSKKYYCLILDESKRLDKISGETEIIRYDNEKDLLNGFLDLWIKLDPTIISGWNSQYFDVPYLYYRMEKIIGKTQASYFSPLNKINPLQRKDRTARANPSPVWRRKTTRNAYNFDISDWYFEIYSCFTKLGGLSLTVKPGVRSIGILPKNRLASCCENPAI